VRTIGKRLALGNSLASERSSAKSRSQKRVAPSGGMVKRSAAMPMENMPARGCAELGHATQSQGFGASAHYVASLKTRCAAETPAPMVTGYPIPFRLISSAAITPSVSKISTYPMCEKRMMVPFMSP